MKIESIHNSHIKELAKLKEKKYRDEQGLFLIEGEHLIKEALKYGKVKEVLSLEEKEYHVPNILVTKDILKKISSQVTPSNEIAVVEKLQEKEMKGTILFLDGIQDPGNLGTIIRSSAAFHLNNIVLSMDSVDLYNEKVVRSTEGMLFQLNIERKSTKEFLQSLKEQNYTIYGTDVANGEKLSDISFEENSCLIIGNEGKGMSDLARSFVTKNISIEMSSSCESLNAGVAASIILYERSKRL